MELQTDLLTPGSALPSGGALQGLEQQLRCPICLDVFSRPVVILPCQHNLCRGCANDLFESRNPFHYSGGSFRCPTCRFDVLLDRKGVYGLQRNLLVENIIDVYKQRQEKHDTGGGGPVLKDKDAKEPQCPDHDGERINIYCLSCQTATCSMCKVFGKHKDCNVSPLHTIHQSQKVELRGAIELLSTGNDHIQALVAQTDDGCRCVQDNAELQKRRLGESFDLLFAILEQRKAELLQLISQEEDARMATLLGIAEGYRQQLLRCDQLKDQMTQTVRTCGVTELLQSSAQLLQDAQEAASPANLQNPRPNYENMEHLKVDTQKAEHLLRRLDFSQDQDRAQDQHREQDQGQD